MSLAGATGLENQNSVGYRGNNFTVICTFFPSFFPKTFWYWQGTICLFVYHGQRQNSMLDYVK